MELNAEKMGPVEYTVISFPENRFQGEITPAIAEAVRDGLIRIIDLAFVTKDPDGATASLEFSQLPPEIVAELNQIDGEITGLLSEQDLEDVGDALDPGSSALMIVWESVWAARIAEAVRNCGGEVAAYGLVPHEAVVAAIAALPA